MAYEILVLDIDGTLTNSNKEISPKTLDSIMKIQERGHKVVLASGRPTNGILPIASKLKLAEYGGYILSFNGARVMNCQTDEVIYQNTLPKQLIPEISQAAAYHNVGIITYENNNIIVAKEIDEFMQKEAAINHMSFKVVDNFTDYVTFDVNKCLMTGEGEYLATVELALQKQFGNVLSIYRSEPYFLEIMPKGIDKAYSLSKLLENLGLTKDQMISCGDGYNDLSMIQYAGMGVAMANAREVVKNAADYITLSNDEDGIAHVIHEFML